MHTFEHEHRLIFFENGPSNNEQSSTAPETPTQPEGSINPEQRAADAEVRRSAEVADTQAAGNPDDILEQADSAAVTSIQNLRTTPDYVAKIQAVAEAIRTGKETDNNVFARIATEVKAQYPQIPETVEQLIAAIQEDVNTEIRNETPNGLEKTLIMIGINQETAHQMREHIAKKEWGKVLQKGLEIFQTVMSTVGDTLAQTFSGFGPDVLQFLPQKIRQMAGGNRMEFYRGINTLTENNIAVIDEKTQEPVKRPNSTKILNEYARLHGPKQNTQTPFVSIEKFMSTLTEQIITKKDSEIQKNATTGVYEITEAQLLNIAKSLQVTPDVTPPPPAPAAAPNTAPAAAPVGPATTPAAPTSTPATPTGTPAPTTPAATPSATPPATT
jgi:hypothetical protein